MAQLAAEVTAGAATPYDQAVAIEQYLRSFPYDETIPRPPAGVDRVEQFLFVTQRGYFDYHASAMAVMLRAVGVPTRLATGYYVDETGEDGRYVLRERHTYSWPEVFFPGAGWVQFNPTPNLPTVGRLGEGGFVEPEIDPAGRGNEFGLGALDITALDELNLGDLAAASPAEALAIDETGGGRSLLWLWLAIGAAGTALFAGGARFAWERSVAGLPGPAKLWEKTIRLSALAGGGPRAQQTPREFARELAARLDGDPGVAKLAGAYEGARFGRREPAEGELDALARGLSPGARQAHPQGAALALAAPRPERRPMTATGHTLIETDFGWVGVALGSRGVRAATTPWPSPATALLKLRGLAPETRTAAARTISRAASPAPFGRIWRAPRATSACRSISWARRSSSPFGLR